MWDFDTVLPFNKLFSLESYRFSWENNPYLIGRSEESCFIPSSSEVDPPWIFLIYPNSPEAINVRKEMTANTSLTITVFKNDYEETRVEKRIITYVKWRYFIFYKCRSSQQFRHLCNQDAVKFLWTLLIWVWYTPFV